MLKTRETRSTTTTKTANTKKRENKYGKRQQTTAESTKTKTKFMQQNRISVAVDLIRNQPGKGRKDGKEG